MSVFWRVLPYVFGAVAVVAVASTWFQKTQTVPAPPPDGARVDPPRMQPGATAMGPMVEYRLENRGWVYAVTATNRDPKRDLCVAPGAFSSEPYYTPFEIVDATRGAANYTRPVAQMISTGPPTRLPPGQAIRGEWNLAEYYDLRGLQPPVTITFSAPFYECDERGL